MLLLLVLLVSFSDCECVAWLKRITVVADMVIAVPKALKE